MKLRLKQILALSLPLQILLVQWARLYPEWIEQYYSQGLYPKIAWFLRKLYGYFPFSIGDIAYLGLGMVAVFLVFKKWRRIREQPWSAFRDVLAVLSVAHATFHVLWGLNYHRIPLGERLGLELQYQEAELVALAEQLALQVNQQQEMLAGNTDSLVRIPYSQSAIRDMTIAGYQKLSTDLPFLQYTPPSLKNSMISTLLSYMGYGGYLNPFTQEAQVNAKLPLFRYPVVCGHEIGHQLGYSAENETNFIGYLVTLRHGDPYFRYAASAYGLGYTLSDVRRKAPREFDRLWDSLNPGVKANYLEMEAFWNSYANPAEPVFKAVFNNFLKANRQRDGIRSYNRVVALILAYHRDTY